MKILFLVAVVLAVEVTSKSQDKHKDYSYHSKIAPDLAKPSKLSVYSFDQTNTNDLCHALDCRKSEVCVVSQDDNGADIATCVKEKHWKKAERKRVRKSGKSSSANLYTPVRSDCPACPVVHPTFVCGTDNATYSSECRLQYKNCEDNTSIQVACQGRCPCPTLEIPERLPAALPRPRNRIQKDYLKEQAAEFGITDNDNHVNVHSQVKVKSKPCTKKDMREMRYRLVDWFHAIVRQKAPEGDSSNGVERPVCVDGENHKVLSWMFSYFDESKDGRLSLRELFDLEADKYEHCVNPFLDMCDLNLDLDISGSEWCRCFQKHLSHIRRG